MNPKHDAEFLQGHEDDIQLYTSHVLFGYAMLLLSRGLLTPAYCSMSESARRDPVLQLFKNLLTNNIDCMDANAMLQQDVVSEDKSIERWGGGISDVRS